MRYRVRGPLHSDTTHIATELRGFIAHTGPIRLGYLQMHGVAAHTIDVSDNGAAFFEETVLPKIGATGSFVEQRHALRKPKELKLAARLCPTTATTLPNLTEWAGVWSEVTYGPRRTTVRLRCLPEDAERLRELESQGWRVLRGPAVALAALSKAAPFAPQFWPSRAGCAASPAAGELPAELPAALPAMASDAAELAPAAKVSSLTVSDVLAAPDGPNLLLGVTPAGQGVRLAWRAMIVAVQDGGQRQDAVIPAMLFRALTQGMGALVIAERSKVTPRVLAPLAKRLRLIDMADPWESARIPWRSISPEGLKLLLGGDVPSPLPETMADALRAVGRRNLATPVVEALTREPAHDLAGTLEAGGGVVLLVEPGASASFLASLLILGLSLARVSRPLLICRPASLPMPPALADRAVQIVFGDAPTAAIQLQAEPDSWLAIFPDGQKLTLQENLAAPVEEQAGAGHAALMSGLQGRGWTPEEAAALAAAPGQLDEGAAGLGWPESLEEGNEAAGLSHANEVPVGLSWPEELDEGDEATTGFPEADEPAAVVTNDELAVILATDVTPGTRDSDEAILDAAGLGWPEELDEGDEAGGTRQSAYEAPVGLGWPEELDEGDEAAAGLSHAGEAPLKLEADEMPTLAAEEATAGLSHADEVPALEADELPLELEADEVSTLAADVAAAGLQEAHEAPLGLEADETPALVADETVAGLQEAHETPPELAGVDLDWPVELGAEEQPALDTDEAAAGLQEADELPLDLAGDAGMFWGSGDDAAGDVEAWPASLLDEGDEMIGLVGGGVSRRRATGRRRGRVSFTPVSRPLAANPANGVSSDGFGLPEANEPSMELAGADLDWPMELEADEAPALAADEAAAGLQEADELPLELAGVDLDWPVDLGTEELPALEADEAAAGLSHADELPLELEANELPALEAAEAAAGLQGAHETTVLEADEAPTLVDNELPATVAHETAAGLQEAHKPPARGLNALVSAWRAGESLTALARELRCQQPTLSLLEATQMLKAAIHSEGFAPASHLPLTPHAPAPVTASDRLVAALRGMAVVEPVEPAAKDALRRWRDGGQRRVVVRDLALTYRMKEPDARMVFDRAIFPHVINDLNGSASAVVSFLRDAGNEQAEIPPAVVDCATRLLGNTSQHISKARALLPVMRELVTMLDETGRM